MRHKFQVLLLITLLGLASDAAMAETPDPLRVFAAASTVAVLETLAARYAQETGQQIVLVPGASGALARQILAGAPADIFISANEGWMETLLTSGLGHTLIRQLWHNRLVAVVPGDAASRNKLKLPETGKLALCDPDSAPCGEYAKAALQHFGLWADAEARAVYAANARATIAWVARGAVSMGFVYASDLHGNTQVSQAYQFPEKSHPRITYQIATISENPAAQAFLVWLLDPPAQKIASEFGYITR